MTTDEEIMKSCGWVNVLTGIQPKHIINLMRLARADEQARILKKHPSYEGEIANEKRIEEEAFEKGKQFVLDNYADFKFLKEIQTDWFERGKQKGREEGISVCDTSVETNSKYYLDLLKQRDRIWKERDNQKEKIASLEKEHGELI